MIQLASIINSINIVDSDKETPYHITFVRGNTLNVSKETLFNVTDMMEKTDNRFAISSEKRWHSCVQKHLDAGMSLIKDLEERKAFLVKDLSARHIMYTCFTRKDGCYAFGRDIVGILIKWWEMWHSNETCNPLTAIQNFCAVDHGIISFNLSLLMKTLKENSIRIKRSELIKILHCAGCKQAVKKYNKKQIRVWQFNTNNL